MHRFSRVRRVAPRLQMQPEKPMASRHGPTKTATLTAPPHLHPRGDQPIGVDGGAVAWRRGRHALRQLEEVRAAAEQRLGIGELVTVGGEQAELDL